MHIIVFIFAVSLPGGSAKPKKVTNTPSSNEEKVERSTKLKEEELKSE